MLEAIVGLVFLYVIFHIARGIVKGLAGASAPPKAPPAPSAPAVQASASAPAPVYRGPRDTTARPAPGGASSPTLWHELAVAAKAARAAQAARAQGASAKARVKAAQRPRHAEKRGPFVIEQRRRFPWAGLFAFLALLALIFALHALLSAPERPPPAGHAERTAKAAVTINASSRVTVMIGPVGRSKAAEATSPAT